MRRVSDCVLQRRQRGGPGLADGRCHSLLQAQEAGPHRPVVFFLCVVQLRACHTRCPPLTNTHHFTHTHARTHAHTHTRTHARTHAHTHTHTHTHKPYTPQHTNIQHTHSHTCAHPFTHPHPPTHTPLQGSRSDPTCTSPETTGLEGGQTPSTGLQSPSSNHCRNGSRHRCPKTVS